MEHNPTKRAQALYKELSTSADPVQTILDWAAAETSLRNAQKLGTMDDEYLDYIEAHLGEGGGCSHANGVALFEELKKRTAILKLAAPVVALADELCDSIDAGAVDVGGCRPPLTIIQEIGPQIDAAARAIAPFLKKRSLT